MTERKVENRQLVAIALDNLPPKENPKFPEKGWEPDYSDYGDSPWFGNTPAYIRMYN